jgi:hypothetical protein
VRAAAILEGVIGVWSVGVLTSVEGLVREALLWSNVVVFP